MNAYPVHLRRKLVLRVEDAEIVDLLDLVAWRLGADQCRANHPQRNGSLDIFASG